MTWRPTNELLARHECAVGGAQARPDPGVAHWFGATDSRHLYVSVLTVGEIRQGITRLQRRDSAQAEVFDRWLVGLQQAYSDRIVPICAAVAEEWGSMRLGLDVSQHQLTWEELLRRVRFAEEAGFESAWIFDHFKPLYGDPSGPCLEAWTLLAALSCATTRVRLGALVTGVTYRHPAILAAEIVTVDHASAGRLEVGMGAAWFEAEHRMFGIDFPPTGERVSRLDEALQVIDRLLTGEDVTFHGRYYTLQKATYRPRPVQQPRPPIWVGAGGRRTIRIAARRANAWHSFGSAAELGRKAALLDEEASRAGQDPSTILRSTDISISRPWDEVRRTAEELASLGFSYLNVSWPREGQGRLDEFVERVMPELVAAGPP